jgi:hypothetical protein
MGQGDAVDLPAQGVQDRLWALDGGFAGDDPPRGPDRRRAGPVRPFLTHQRPKQPATARREGLDGHQVGRASWWPLAPVRGDPPSRYAAVHLGMVGQGTGPGVQPTQDPDEPADIMRGHGQLHERWGGGTQADLVEGLRMPSDHLPQLLGHGADHVNGGDRAELLTPFFQPGLGRRAMALRPTAMAAGMVDIMLLATVSTRPQVPAQDRRATVENLLSGAPMAGEQILPEPGQVGTASTPKDLRSCRPVRSARASRSAMRAVMVACTTSQVGGVRGVERAVVLRLLCPSRACMTRRETPRAKRWVASERRRGWMEASWAMPRWRTTALNVLWREVADTGIGRCRAGNHQRRDRACCQSSRHRGRVRSARGP